MVQIENLKKKKKPEEIEDFQNNFIKKPRIRQLYGIKKVRRRIEILEKLGNAEPGQE